MLEGFRGLSNAKRLGVAALAGALAASALPPLYLLPLQYIGFFLLGMLIITSKTPKNSGYEGFTFGFSYALLGFYWIVNSMLVNPSAHAWLAPLALPILAGLIALFSALPMYVVARLSGKFTKYFFAVGLFSAAEWLRGTLFQFPWNTFSLSFSLSEILLQPLSVLGRDGYSFLVIASLLLPAFAFTASPRTLLGKRWFLPTIALAIPAIFFVWGMVRLDQAPDPRQNYWANAGMRLVQPNIAQADKINPEMAGENLTKLIDLSLQDLPGWINHIIWPEVALHLDIHRYDKLVEDLGSILPIGGVLISGSLRKQQGNWYNSLIAIDSNSELSVLHDKVTLVPFGEYSPIPFLRGIADEVGGFSQGEALQAHSIGLLPLFSSLICYEVIFSGNVTPKDSNPQWLLNVTNDAWFGHSTGPFQHHAISQWRAIEEGLPLVRVANTGISSVFDAYGRILAQKGLREAGTINIRLPKPLDKSTFFQNNGKILWLILLALFTIVGSGIWLWETRPKLKFEL